jgi:hypothetical protein
MTISHAGPSGYLHDMTSIILSIKVLAYDVIARDIVIQAQQSKKR